MPTGKLRYYRLNGPAPNLPFSLGHHYFYSDLYNEAPQERNHHTMAEITTSPMKRKEKDRWEAGKCKSKPPRGEVKAQLFLKRK